MRFQIKKVSGMWALAAVDHVAGAIPLMFSPDWQFAAETAARVSVEYTLRQMERAEAVR